MKTYINSTIKNIVPENYKDVYLYLLILVVISPILTLFKALSFFKLNLYLLILMMLCLLINCFCKRKSLNKIKTGSLLLIILACLMIVVSYFSTNRFVTFTGIYDYAFRFESLPEYLYFILVAICAINMDKRNVKFLINLILFVTIFVVVYQFIKNNYKLIFYHENHIGYYLSVTIMLTAGMFLFERTKTRTLFYACATILQAISLCLNGSFGPIVGLLAYMIVGIIFIAIRKKELLKRFLAIVSLIILSFFIFDYASYSICVCILTFFVVGLLYLLLNKKWFLISYLMILLILPTAIIFSLPQKTNYRTEESTTIEKIIGVSKVALNKIGLIDDKKMESENIAQGSDGYARLDMWKRAIENIEEKPLTGVGAGTWHLYNPDMPSIKPHNEFLQYGSEFGMLVLGCYLAILFYVFIEYRKNFRLSSNESFIFVGAVFVYVVQSVFGNVMCCSAPIFYLVLGLAIKELNLIDKQRQIDKNEVSNDNVVSRSKIKDNKSDTTKKVENDKFIKNKKASN